jgi:hypothetical protein
MYRGKKLRVLIGFDDDTTDLLGRILVFCSQTFCTIWIRIRIKYFTLRKYM